MRQRKKTEKVKSIQNKLAVPVFRNLDVTSSAYNKCWPQLLFQNFQLLSVGKALKTKPCRESKTTKLVKFLLLQSLDVPKQPNIVEFTGNYLWVNHNQM